MELSDFPKLNACLNGLSTVFLSCGWHFIKQGRKNAHRNCMVSALITSALFLASYLTYHFYAGRTVFLEPAWFRPIYLVLLLTHTVLAIVIVPLVLMSVSRALRERWEPHKKISRWTLPPGARDQGSPLPPRRERVG